jgi:L-lactate utilization protein LutC
MTATQSTAATVPPPTTELTPNPEFARLADYEQVQRAIAALEANGIKATVAANRADALRTVLEMIPKGSSVLDAPSQTMLALGFPEAMASAGIPSLKAELMQLRQENNLAEMRRRGAAPDVVVGSVHALTEKGQVVVASASGSQLGPYAAGAGKVIWVVGTQKIVPDLETAFRRIEEYTYPLENERAKKAYGRGSFVAKLLVVNREFQPGRISVILVPENLGF